MSLETGYGHGIDHPKPLAGMGMVVFMLWHRYRRAIAWSLPLGAAGGAGIALVMYATGNPDYRSQGGSGALIYLLVLGVAVGAATALAALIGGSIAIVAKQRSLRRNPHIQVAAGVIGAGIGAGLLWIVVGVVNAIVTPTGASWIGVIIIFALIAAVSSAVLASVVLGRSERQAKSTT